MAIDIGTAVAYLNLDSTNFNTGLNAAYSALQEFERKGYNLGNTLSGVGQTMANTGYTLTKSLTVPLVNFGTSAMDSYRSFESAFAGVRKTIDDTEVEAVGGYKVLKDAIEKMATETASSAEDIAAVMEMAGQLGIPLGEAGEDITKFTKTMVMLGDSTNLAADEAALNLAKFMNITGTAAADSDRLGSAVVDLGNKFATQEDQIVNMSTRLASAGTIAGLTQQEILALATAMSSAGIRAEAGGSAMATTLTQIEKIVQGVTENSAEQIQTLAKIAGMSAEEFTRAWEEDPITALTSFLHGLGNLEDQGESAVVVLDELGMTGVRQSNMLKALALSAENMDYALEVSNQAWQDNTALVTEANKRYETMDSKISQLTERWNIMKRQIAEILLPILEKLMEVVQKIIDKWNSLSDEQKQSVIRIAEIVAAVGPLLVIFGKLLTTIGTIVKIMETLKAINMLGVCHEMGECAEGTAGSIGKVGEAVGGVIKTVAGIAAVIGGIVIAARSFFDMWNNGFSAAKEAVMLVGVALTAIGAILLGAPAMVAGVIAAIVAAVATAAILIHEHWDEIKAWWNDMVDKIKEKWSEFWGKAKDFVEKAKEEIDERVDAIKESVSEKIEKLKNTIQEKLNNLKTFIKNLIEDIKNGISQKIEEIKQNVYDTVQSIKGNVQSKLKEIYDEVTEKIKAIRDFVFDKIKEIKENVENKVEELKESIKNKILQIKEDAISKMEEIRNTVERKISEIKQQVEQRVEDIKQIVTTLLTVIKDMAFQKIEEIRNAVVSKITEIKNNLAEKINEIKENLRSNWENFKNIGKELLNAFWEGMKEIFTPIWNWVVDKFGGLLNWVRDVWNEVSSLGSRVGGWFNGSHANGLDYVPFDGYVAQLHQGERVLTKQEAKEYNEGKSSSSNNTINIYSYEKLDEYEVSNQVRRTMRDLSLGFY